MLTAVIVDFFKHKIVGSLIILHCWSVIDRASFIREINQHGMSATFLCDPNLLENIDNHRFQGILYMKQDQDISLESVKLSCFSNWYKWLVIGNGVPEFLHRVRYDSDISLLNANISELTHRNASKSQHNRIFYLEDVYVHPKSGATLHPWAAWTNGRLQVTHEREKILRRADVKGHPMTIATPMGHFTEDTYEGTFEEYVLDNRMPERDSATRCCYSISSLILQTLNATEVLVPTLLWSTEVHNNSMMLMVASGTAEISGSVLRPLHYRMERLDYIIPMWPFSVGFTYLAERMSNSNMYVEPFTAGVWMMTLGICVVLAVAQHITSRNDIEREGAYISVIATWLQQDASAVPEGLSGRWTFTVMSISSMLVYAYYTSAIVSALMSTGRNGPDSLRALGDSRYAIASEDYDWIRYQMFDVVTNYTDLEYLKRKKRITPSFYQPIERGVQLIQEGNTAFHSEYNQIYKFLRTFTDDHVCKVQYVDTISESMSWITSKKRGQWTDVLRSAGNWIHETGLAKRTLSRWRILPPPCRSALLAERVKFGDVAPLLVLTLFGAVVSVVILGLEILYAKWKRDKIGSSRSDLTVVSIT